MSSKKNFMGGAIAAAVYIIFAPRVNKMAYNRRLFHPKRGCGTDYNPAEISGTKRSEVYFKSANGNSLHAWLFRKAETQKVILYSHGNAGNIVRRLDIIKLLLQTDASLFIYDYQGFGRSQGKPSITGICEDGIAAFDYLVSAGFRPEDIILNGESLGTGVSMHIAARRVCRSIILHAPFYSLWEIAREKIPFLHLYPKALMIRPELNNAEALTRQHAPVLIIHSKKDRTIPLAHGKAIFDEAIEPKQFLQLEAATHTEFRDDSQIYLNAVSKFIAA